MIQLPTSPALPLSLLASAAVACSFPATAQARPANVQDCLRPPQAIMSAPGSAVLAPASAQPQLLAQAMPATNPPQAARVTTESQARPSARPLLAQASAPATLPACTYDPPRPESPQIIRGLW